MAKIVASDHAPKGNYRFSLANAEIEKLPYETNDPAVIANAETHPWLDVEYDEVKELADLRDPNPQLAPEDDALSAQNSVANDPKAVKAAIEARFGDHADDGAVAIDAGLDQSEVVETGDRVAETVAAIGDTKTDKESKS